MISHLLGVDLCCGCSLVQGRVATLCLDRNVGHQELHTLGCFAKQEKYQTKQKNYCLNKFNE